jgi:hypothetical protein
MLPLRNEAYQLFSNVSHCITTLISPMLTFYSDLRPESYKSNISGFTVPNGWPRNESLPYPILLVIAVGMVGVVRQWRWLFWLLLLAFGTALLDIAVTVLQVLGVLPNVFPLWYSLFRMGVALPEIAPAIWMMRLYRRHGVWAMGKKHACR